jgi:O-antigen/teichoic acid export membrane protein
MSRIGYPQPIVRAGTAQCRLSPAKKPQHTLSTMSAKASVALGIQQGECPSLASDFCWTFVGNAIYAAGQFTTLILLAKLLRPQLVGEYALGLAIVYPVMMLTNLQLRSVFSSGSRQHLSFSSYLCLRALTTSLAFVMIFALTKILGYGRELTTVVLMVGLAYAVETFSDVYYARLQRHDRMAEIARSMIARALLAVLGLAAATYVTRSLLWGIASIVLARAIVLFAYDAPKGAEGLSGQPKCGSRNEGLALHFDPKALLELFWVSLPLGVVALLGCLNSSIPNFFIMHSLGEREVGIFAAIGFMVSAGNMAVVSLGQAAYTRLARACAAGDLGAFHSLLGKLLACGAAIGVSGVIVSKFAGREILTLLFRPEYAEWAGLLPWIMVAGGVLFMAQFLGFGLTAANFYRSQVVLNVVANLSLLAACYWFVEPRGLLGAILAMLIAAIVQLAGSVVVLLIGMPRHTSGAGERVEQRHAIRTIPARAEQISTLNARD